MGPSYSLSVTNALAAGVSLHGVATSDSFVVDGSSLTSLAGSGAAQSALGTAGSGYSFDVAAILGATYGLGPWTVGASVQFPAVHVLGRYQATSREEHGGMSGVTDVADLTNGSGTFSAPPPTRAALGIGVELPRVTLEVDGSLDLPASSAISTSLRGASTDLAGGQATTSPLGATYAIRSRPTANAAAGVEYFLSRTFSLLGGVSTNFSTLPALSPTSSVGNLVQSRANYAGASFGIGSYGGGADLILGVRLDYGWGQALVVNPYVLPNEWAVVGTQSYAATFVLAGATDLPRRSDTPSKRWSGS